MSALPAPVDGVVHLPAGDTVLGGTLRVTEDLVIDGAGAARLVMAGAGPLIEHLRGRLTLRRLGLARTGGFEGLLWSQSRLVCEEVRLEGARSWWKLPEPRPEHPLGMRSCTAVVELHGRAHATLSRCSWADNERDAVMVTEGARATVQGGSITGADASGLRVSGGTLSVRDLHVPLLAGPVSVSGADGKLRLSRCTFGTPSGPVVHIWDGDATIKDCTLGPGGDAVVVYAGRADITGGSLRACSRNGVFARGTAAVELAGVELLGHGWVGIAVSGVASVSATGGSIRACNYGVLADAAGRARLRDLEIRDNRLKGIEACDDAAIDEEGVQVGVHPDRERCRWHRADWIGAEVTAEPFSAEERLAWVKRRLSSSSECPDSRARLLAALPEVLADADDGPWLAERLAAASSLTKRRGWPAAVEAVQAAGDDEAARRVATALEIPAAPETALLCTRSFQVDGAGGPLFAGETADGEALGWLALPSGPLVALTPDGEIGDRLSLAEQAHAVHQRGRRLAAAGRSRAWLFDLDTGATISSWHTTSEQLGTIRVIADDAAVELWSLETTGHPTDRSGLRRRLRVGQGIYQGEILERRQGLLPDVPLLAPLPLSPDHLDLHLGFDRETVQLRRRGAAEPLATWQAPDLVTGVLPFGPQLLVATMSELYVLRWRFTPG